MGKAGKNTANDCAPQNNVPIVLPADYFLAGLGLVCVTVNRCCDHLAARTFLRKARPELAAKRRSNIDHLDDPRIVGTSYISPATE